MLNFCTYNNNNTLAQTYLKSTLFSSVVCCFQANGFYGGKGVAGHVPMMYIYFARKFVQAVYRRGYQDHIRYLEYYRKGWTFHGKGLWYYSNGEVWPSLTLMGSTNYGKIS